MSRKGALLLSKRARGLPRTSREGIETELEPHAEYEACERGAGRKGVHILPLAGPQYPQRPARENTRCPGMNKVARVRDSETAKG